jgi:hypothetical protein
MCWDLCEEDLLILVAPLEQLPFRPFECHWDPVLQLLCFQLIDPVSNTTFSSINPPTCGTLCGGRELILRRIVWCRWYESFAKRIVARHRLECTIARLYDWLADISAWTAGKRFAMRHSSRKIEDTGDLNVRNTRGTFGNLTYYWFEYSGLSSPASTHQRKPGASL